MLLNCAAYFIWACCCLAWLSWILLEWFFSCCYCLVQTWCMDFYWQCSFCSLECKLFSFTVSRFCCFKFNRFEYYDEIISLLNYLMSFLDCYACDLNIIWNIWSLGSFLMCVLVLWSSLSNTYSFYVLVRDLLKQVILKLSRFV